MNTNSNSISIGTFEATTKLSELLERVSKGVSFTITKHNKPVARLTRVEKEEDEAEQLARRIQAAKEIRALCAHNRLNGLSIRELINEGRR